MMIKVVELNKNYIFLHLTQSPRKPQKRDREIISISGPPRTICMMIKVVELDKNYKF